MLPTTHIATGPACRWNRASRLDTGRVRPYNGRDLKVRAAPTMLRSLSLMLILLCWPGPGDAVAEAPIRVQTQPLRQACAEDYMRFCRGILPGGGRILACLNARVEDLSQPCFQALALSGLASAGAMRVCRADYERHCAHVVPGGGRGLACLWDHMQAISPTCREMLEKLDPLNEGPDPPLPPK